MSTPDHFAPPSRKRVLGYGISAAIVLTAAVVLLGSLDGSLGSVELLRVLLIVTLPCLALLGLVYWLSSGERAEVQTPTQRILLPVRLKKALPYMLWAIILLNLIKALEIFLK